MREVENNVIKWLIADDHSIVRQGVELLILEKYPDSIILHASCLQHIKESLLAQKPDILILDAQFPDGNAINFLPEIKSLCVSTKILIFTSSDEEKYVLRFLDAGADGFLSKICEEEQIQFAILNMVNEGNYLSSLAQKLLLTSVQNPQSFHPLSKLSERELQIAKLFAEGYGNLEIANDLDIKQNTVSTVKKRIYNKLNVNTMIELVDMIRI